MQALAEGSFDLMITDVAMPGLNGLELARRARALAPAMPILFASGYADLDRFGSELGDESLLKKPFRINEVAARIGQELELPPVGVGSAGSRGAHGCASSPPPAPV